MQQYINFILDSTEDNEIDRENLEKLNEVLEVLGLQANIKKYPGNENVSAYRYINILYDVDELEQKRTRGAGRKVNSDVAIAKWSEFCELKAQGKTKEEIMETMGISRATYYRYLKSY